MCAAIRCLGAMAESSQTRFGELLTVFNSLRNEQVRGSATTCLYLIMRKHPEFLMACLNSPQSEVSYSAMRFMDSLSRGVLVKMTYSLDTATNDKFYVMKEIDNGDKRRLQDAIPILVDKLRDEKLETRQLATNVLLELNPKAAKQAGVHLEMPYSYYAQ